MWAHHLVLSSLQRDSSFRGLLESDRLLGNGHARECHHRDRRQPLQTRAHQRGGGCGRGGGHRKGLGRRRGGLAKLKLHCWPRPGGCLVRRQVHRRGESRGANQIRRRGAHRNGHSSGGHGRHARGLRARVVSEPEDRSGRWSGKRHPWVEAVRWVILKRGRRNGHRSGCRIAPLKERDALLEPILLSIGESLPPPVVSKLRGEYNMDMDMDVVPSPMIRPRLHRVRRADRSVRLRYLHRVRYFHRLRKYPVRPGCGPAAALYGSPCPCQHSPFACLRSAPSPRCAGPSAETAAAPGRRRRMGSWSSSW